MATKRMKCIRGHDKSLTVGKIYEVEPSQHAGHVTVIKDDKGISQSWFSDRFEEITEYSVKDTQVGGSHYHTLKIQPYEYVLANNLGPLELNIIKYVTRWKNKNGVEDLKKARHTLDYLIEYTEKQNGA